MTIERIPPLAEKRTIAFEYRLISTSTQRTIMPKRARDAGAAATPTTDAAPRFWLMKSEPDAFSIDDLKEKTVSPWDGVRNYAARNHMMSMQVGDHVLFYHSNAKPSGIVGTARVVRTAYPDFTAVDPKSKYFDRRLAEASSSKSGEVKCVKENPWQMVDVRYESKFGGVLSLEMLRGDKALSDMVLFRQGRLSVQPVTEAQFKRILFLAAKLV